MDKSSKITIFSDNKDSRGRYKIAIISGEMFVRIYESGKVFLCSNGDDIISEFRYRDNGNGYLKIQVCFKKSCGCIVDEQFFVHRLVAQAFLSENISGMVVNHIDFDRANNNIKNIEIVTSRENNLHGSYHNPNRKNFLKFEMYKKIVDMYKYDIKNRSEIARRLGIKFGVVQGVISVGKYPVHKERYINEFGSFPKSVSYTGKTKR